ncbi:type I polyketide synthase [Streptomyces sp. NPDC049555]|uniref:type I polyketide synthase n=1 Tax=Streptomyces sp. NPDC049555 TaxID=3154930 RepID=UPI0034301CD5
MTCRVAVVGLACRYPDADDPQALWQTVLAGRRAFRRLPPGRLPLTEYAGGGPDGITLERAAVLEGWTFDRAAFRVPGSTHRAADPAHWLALDVAAAALRDAGAPGGEGLDPARVGVVLGNSLTGEFSRTGQLRLRWPYVRRTVDRVLAEHGTAPGEQRAILRDLEAAYKQPFPEPGDETLAGSLANTISGRICNHFGFHGTGHTVDAACASSLVAVGTACTLLAQGDLDIALAGGVDLSLDPFELVGFSRLGALADGPMRIYDRRPTGFLPGEGCGIVVLAREETAERLGLRPYARIDGWGTSSDGHGGLTRPERTGQALALHRAWQRAGHPPGTVGLVEGHGTGTAVGDRVELAVLDAALRAGDGRRARPAALGSIKANIGHTKAAAGVAGLLKAVLAVHHGMLPPTTGCEDPHELLTGPDPVVEALATPEPWPTALPRRACVNSSGFGGINAHVVLSGTDTSVALPWPHPADPGCEIVPLSGHDPAELTARLTHLATLAATLSEAELTDTAAALARHADPTAPLRVAVVAASPTELADRLRTAAQTVGKAHLDARGGVFAGTGPALDLGLLLPGQGTPGHRTASPLLARLVDGDDLHAEVPDPQPGHGTADTAVVQPAVVAASLTGLRYLDRLGVRATAAVGHSLGELTALCWAGALDPAAAVALARTRGSLMAHYGESGGGMLAVGTDPDTAELLLRGTGAVIAAVNGPHRVTVAGPRPALSRFREEADRHGGIPVAPLAVSHAFHSPAMRPALPALADCFARADLRTPLTGTVISTVTGAPLPPDTNLATHLTEHTLTPVRFAEAVRELATRVDILLEVGPGTTLTPLTPTGLPTLSLDTTTGTPRAVATVTAALFAACGATPLPWTTDRFTRPIDVDRPRTFLTNPCEAMQNASAAPEPTPADPARGAQLPAGSGAEPREGSGAAALAGPGAEPPTGPGAQPRAGVRGRSPRETVKGRDRGRPAAGAPTTGSHPAPAPAPAGAATRTLRHLLSTTLELAPETIHDDDLLLTHLHINSLRIAQIAAEAAQALGRAAPTDTSALAGATVAGLAAYLEALPTAAAADDDDRTPAGAAGPWVRAYTHHLQPRPAAAPPAAPVTYDWTYDIPEPHPLAPAVRKAFPAGGEGPRATVVALPPDVGRAPDPWLAALRAAAAATTAPLLVVHHRGPGPVLARSLAAERPGLDCLVVDVPPHSDGLSLAAAEAARGIRGYAEVVYDDDGRRHVPVTAHHPLPPPDAAAVPLGPADVCLVTGGAKGIGAESALALARATGVRCILLGRSDPTTDAEAAATLRRFAAEGLTARYAVADVTDPDAVRRAVTGAVTGAATGVVTGAAAGTGPVTAVLHCAGRNDPARIEDLTPARLRAALAPKCDGLEAVLAAVDPQRLRLLVTYGSVIARIGLPGEAHYALANDRLRHRTEELAAALPHCRCLSVEWSQWEGTGMAHRLGAVEALRRQGVVPIPVAAGTRVLLSLLAADDLPTTVMVAGRLPRTPTLRYADESLPLLRFLERPLVHQPGVEVVAEARVGLGSDPYLADHALDGVPLLPAVVGLEAMAQAAAAVTGHDTVLSVTDVAFERPVTVPLDGSRTLRVAALRHDDGTVATVVRSDETGFAADHFRAVYRTSAEPAPALPSGRTDPTRSPHYGDLFFHGPRFRRLVRYRRLSGRSCVAEVAAGGAGEWFGGFHGPRLLLGDAALRDAYVHVLQGCVPHRRVLPVAVDAVRFHGAAPAEGTLLVHAHETAHDADGYRYDVRVEDATGTVLETWHGLRLKDVGPLPRPAGTPWPAELLGPYLTRSLDHLLPDAHADLAAGAAADVPPGAADGFRSAAHLGDRALVALAGRPVAVDWAPVPGAPPERWRALLGPRAAAVADEADRATGGEPGHGYARLLTCRQTLLALGARPDAPLRVERVTTDGWVLLRAGDLTVATVVVRVTGLPSPVAVAIGAAPPVRVPRSVRVRVAGGRA